MICHLSLAIGIFNLLLIVYVVRRAERRRLKTEATDRVLDAIVRTHADRRPPRA